ncbi:MAG TPA: hypothetical protein VF637_07715 [Sphingomicrobium sp.]|jgi:hypothetical protein
MRICTTCGVSKPLDDYYRHPNAAEGRSTKCAECTKVYVKANRALRIDYYREFDRLRARDPKRAQARAEYGKANPRPRPEPDPVKRAARVIVGNALRNGKLVRPEHCDVCAQSCTPHGHHDDYSKPLDLIWCCTSCHALIHAYWRAQERRAA